MNVTILPGQTDITERDLGDLQRKLNELYKKRDAALIAHESTKAALDSYQRQIDGLITTMEVQVATLKTKSTSSTEGKNR